MLSLSLPSSRKVDLEMDLVNGLDTRFYAAHLLPPPTSPSWMSKWKWSCELGIMRNKVSFDTRGDRSFDPDRCSHSVRVPPSYQIRESRTMRLETAFFVRSKRQEFQAFTFTNASESPDVSSLFTCKISFGKWLNNSVPHSFSSDNAT